MVAMLPQGYEVFDGDPIPPLRVTIQGTGREIGFNRSVYDALGRPPLVLMAWNPKERTIALQAAPGAQRGARKVRKQTTSNSYLVSAATFLAQYGLDEGKAALSVSSKDGVVYAAFKDPGAKERKPKGAAS